MGGRGERGEGRGNSLFLVVFYPNTFLMRRLHLRMVLALTHTKFEVYKLAGEIILECYQLMTQLPKDEKYNLIQQIKRASLSVKLNIAEGASRKSIAERKRFYEIARGSLVELDSALDVCTDLCFLKSGQLIQLGSKMNSCYAMLSKLISK